MKTIWKFELTITESQSILMPKDAEILTVQIQKGKPVLWAFVNTHGGSETRVIETHGTGHPIREREVIKTLKYIGTYQLPEAGFVGHVFERLE